MCAVENEFFPSLNLPYAHINIRSFENSLSSEFKEKHKSKDKWSTGGTTHRYYVNVLDT